VHRKTALDVQHWIGAAGHVCATWPHGQRMPGTPRFVAAADHTFFLFERAQQIATTPLVLHRRGRKNSPAGGICRVGPEPRRSRSEPCVGGPAPRAVSTVRGENPRSVADPSTAGKDGPRPPRREQPSGTRKSGAEKAERIHGRCGPTAGRRLRPCIAATRQDGRRHRRPLECSYFSKRRGRFIIVVTLVLRARLPA